MSRFGTERREERRPARAAGVALSLSLHAGVAWSAWVGLSTPPQTEPVPIAVRFIEVAPPAAASASEAPPAPAAPAPAPAQAAKPEPAAIAEVPPQVEVPPPPVEVAQPQVEAPPPVEALPPPVEAPPPEVEAPKPEKVEKPRETKAAKKTHVRPQRRVAQKPPPPHPVRKTEPPPLADAPPAPPAPVEKPMPAPAVAMTPSPADAVARDDPAPPERPATGAPGIEAASRVASAAPLSAPRFDAAYLRNPPPEYPRASRRLGEQGRVVLRVRVEADGRPSRLEVQHSSGSPRLDDAALDAVRRWSFVAARRGDEKVAAWVLVPMEFRLNGS